MSASDALARAREVAARLTAAALVNKSEGEGAEAAAGGKRKSRGWGEEAQLPAGTAGEVTKKIVLPPNTGEINYSTLVIGPKGANHRRLVETSGVQKLVIRGRGTTSGGNDAEEDPYVLLSGTAEAVEKASEQLHKLFNDPQEALRLKDAQLRNLADEKSTNDGGTTNNNSGGGIGFQMRVPNHLVGYVIGKGGENIHRMQSLSGGRVQIQKETEMQPEETHRIVTLTGTNEAVEDMKQRIEEIIRNRTGGFDAGGGGGVGGRDARPMASSTTRLDQMSVVYKVPVPGDRIGLIIGKGGATIRQIQDKTRTVVQIPNDADADNPSVRTISIGGESHEACMAAQQEIQQAIMPHQHQQGPSSSSSANSANTTIFVPIPDERAGGVIGKGGCTIKELQSRLRVKVTVPPQAEPNTFPPMRMAQVSGAPEAVQQARTEIERMIVNAVPGIARGFNNGGGGGLGVGGGGYGQQHDPLQQAASYGSGGAEGRSAYQHQHQQHQQQHQYQQDHLQQQQPQQHQEQPQNQQQEGVVDLTQYYGDFWNYAMHYGERAARLYYAAWSPPEGTAPPPGVVVAPDIELQGVDAAAAPAVVSATADPAAPAATAEAEAGATAEAEAGAGAIEAGEEAAVEAQPSAEVLAYRAQYKAWWDEHGKAAGAPEVPPE